MIHLSVHLSTYQELASVLSAIPYDSVQGVSDQTNGVETSRTPLGLSQCFDDGAIVRSPWMVSFDKQYLAEIYSDSKCPETPNE